MKTFRGLAVIAVVACVMAPAVFGQRMFGGGPRDFGSSQMAKIFGKNQAFTATADMTIADKQRGEPMQMSTAYAFLKGNVRTEMDMTSMKGASMPPQAVAQMKQMGMDRSVSIYRSDKKLLYLVYPGLNAYCEIDPSKMRQPDKTEQKEPKIEITQVGKETVDGHPCVKNKITITSDDGTHEILAWQATDLNDFPIKTEMQTGDSTITTHFRDIKLSAPSASLFEPPTEYKRFDSMQEMMMSSMQKMMPPGGMPSRGGMPARGGDNE
jgi:hypothetical protein